LPHIWVTGETKEQQRHGGYAVALKFSMTFLKIGFWAASDIGWAVQDTAAFCAAIIK
jgi:hypothetical protein